MPSTGAGSPSSTPSQSPSAAGGASELEVLEPEPPSSASSGSDSEQEGESAAEASADASTVAQGGAQSGGAETEAGAQAGGPSGGATGAGAAGAATAGGPEALDQTLNSSVEGFEGEMQNQILILASNRPPADLEGGGEGGGSEQGGSEGEEADGGGTGESGEGPGLVLVDDPSQLPPAAGEPGSGRGATSGAITEDGGMPGDTSTRKGENRNALVTSRVPGDVGDGSDDDVVARQIREAAMNERDPVLREKLWEEYRNYKKAIR